MPDQKKEVHMSYHMLNAENIQIHIEAASLEQHFHQRALDLAKWKEQNYTKMLELNNQHLELVKKKAQAPPQWSFPK